MKKTSTLIAILLPFFLVLFSSGCLDYIDEEEEECGCIEPEEYKNIFSENFLYGSWEGSYLVLEDTVNVYLEFEKNDIGEDYLDEYVYYEQQSKSNNYSYHESGTYYLSFSEGETYEMLPEDLELISFFVKESSILENIGRENGIKFEMIDLGEKGLVLKLNLGDNNFREFTKQ